MNRTQWVLTGLLIVQLLLLLAVGAPFSSGSATVGQKPLLPVLDSVTATRIQITQSTEDDDKSVVLQRKEEGWTLADRAGYPADASQVDRLLEDLKSINVRRPVVSSGRYHEALEVTADKHQRRLRLWEDASDDPDIDLFVGSSPNYQISHVRLAGDDRVYEVRGLNPYDLRTDPIAWVNKKFLDIAFDDVTAVKLTNGHGEFALERHDGAWRLASPPAGETLDQSKIDSFVRSVASLWLSEPAGPASDAAYGLADPAATVEITYGPGGEGVDSDTGGEAFAGPVQVETLVIGGPAEQDSSQRYATRSGFDYAVILSKYDAEKALDKKLADLYEEDDDNDDEE